MRRWSGSRRGTASPAAPGVVAALTAGIAHREICVDARGVPDPTRLDRQTLRAVRDLAACPTWYQGDARDPAFQRRVLGSLHHLSRLDTATLRAAVKAYLAELGDPSVTGSLGTSLACVDGSARVLMLNRYAFAVPERAPPDLRPFSGFIPDTGLAEDYSPLWPFAVGGRGDLVLVGRVCRCGGPGYDALGEFDYFSWRFGRRPSKARP